MGYSGDHAVVEADFVVRLYKLSALNETLSGRELLSMH